VRDEKNIVFSSLEYSVRPISALGFRACIGKKTKKS